MFKEMVSSPPWETAQIFKDAFHRVQELSDPRCKKTGKEGKR